jgi:hypothetical protein
MLLYGKRSRERFTDRPSWADYKERPIRGLARSFRRSSERSDGGSIVRVFHCYHGIVAAKQPTAFGVRDVKTKPSPASAFRQMIGSPSAA